MSHELNLLTTQVTPPTNLTWTLKGQKEEVIILLLCFIVETCSVIITLYADYCSISCYYYKLIPLFCTLNRQIDTFPHLHTDTDVTYKQHHMPSSQVLVLTL